ncbi:MAG: hypothetical protein E6J24_04850 [Chloroflexi bacterium]|nr:MAG: hypothetical protein E6J24_04850 [Chloroflexota bacterium]
MTAAMACEGARSTRLLAVVFTAGGVLSSCFGDPGIQVRAINTSRTTATVYEEPREARSDLTLGIGPCSVTIRAVDDAKAVVFCRKYAQDELTRDPRVVVDTERRC